MTSVMQDLIDINNLSYLSDTDASVAVQRQQIELTPPKTKYSGGSKIIFKLRGMSFRDFQNSAFIFKLKRIGLSAATFSNGGSAMNLINRVVVSSSTGQTVSDVENMNLYEVHKSQIDDSLEYITAVGGAYVDLSNNQTIAGKKAFSNATTFNDKIHVYQDIMANASVYVATDLFLDLASYHYYGDASTNGSYRTFINPLGYLETQKTAILLKILY